MKKIVFCGGGSAGHVIPNICIAEELKGKYIISYLGTNGIEKEICLKNNIAFREFSGVKLVRGKLICNLALPIKLAKSIRECKQILKEEGADLLFCKGGYASYPPAVAAHGLKIPILTHESDLSPGLANKLIARRAERVLTSFRSTALKFGNGLYTGSPMRSSIFGRDRFSAVKYYGLDFRPTILVFGGGSGSQKINKALRECLPELLNRFNVLHICGKGNMIANNAKGYVQLEFCADMGLAYACADYAVARCGSNSAFELIVKKIPTLFIPLENKATRGDQVENADYFAKRGLCRILSESELCGESLLQGIKGLTADGKIKAALGSDDTISGNKNIINVIEEFI